MIPARVAIALQADGWWLRDEIVWAKPNPMPSSVTDRTTPAHEMVYLLTKAPRYFYDVEAIREPHVRIWDETNGGNLTPGRDYAAEQGDPISGGAGKRTTYPLPNPAGRNKRSVWTIPTAPYPEAHFATFPPKLIEPMILAGTSARGACPECGAPWERVTSERPYPKDLANARKAHGGAENNLGGQRHQDWLARHLLKTLGWRPTCNCRPAPYFAPSPEWEPIPCTVLDPFGGSGTVGQVAQLHSRRTILIDLNPDYLRQCLERNAQSPLGLETA